MPPSSVATTAQMIQLKTKETYQMTAWTSKELDKIGTAEELQKAIGHPVTVLSFFTRRMAKSSAIYKK